METKNHKMRTFKIFKAQNTDTKNHKNFIHKHFDKSYVIYVKISKSHNQFVKDQRYFLLKLVGA